MEPPGRRADQLGETVFDMHVDVLERGVLGHAVCSIFLGNAIESVGDRVGIRLVDFKMETGRLWENDLMRIVVADEISPDSCRLWDIKSSEKLDKDRFRRDLGGLVEAYTEVAKRLGIMSEGERPQGSGPVLVKG